MGARLFFLVCVIAALAGAPSAGAQATASLPPLAAGATFEHLLDAGMLNPAAATVTGSASMQSDPSPEGEGGAVRFGPRRAVDRLPCRPGDSPETDLQGRVPPVDVATGRAAQGYRCNMQVVGNFPSSSAATLEAFGDCAYFGKGSDATGTQVLDVSNPAAPVPAGVLATPAMTSPWESLRVNAKRKLLVADRWQIAPVDEALNGYLDIYDVSDCKQPRLISSTDLSPARGHEGWFSPDGMTYYMSTTGPDGAPTVFPIDISDPAHPKRLASWTFPSQTHGGSTTEDGTRSYICQQQAPPKDQLLIVDTSEVAARKPNPQEHLLAQVPLDDNQWCQAAYRVTYGGHPYLIQYGERSGSADCSRAKDNWANFGYPRIFDLADERHPKLVSTALLDVDLPQHCQEVTGEGALNGLGYSVHHCTLDRLYNPTIMACAYFGAGMRVTDIRDPYHPVEIGYYNPGTTGVVGTGARPIIRAERGEIWFVNDVQGFYVVRFEDGIWPFKDAARCPEFDDYTYAQYNPGSSCSTANLNGIGKPAPGGVAASSVRKPEPALRLRVTPARDRRAPYRFRVSGSMVTPDGIPLGTACTGPAKLTARAAGRVVLTRQLRVGPACRLATTVTLRRKRTQLTFTLRFRGNDALAAASRQVTARAG